MGRCIRFSLVKRIAFAVVLFSIFAVCALSLLINFSTQHVQAVNAAGFDSGSGTSSEPYIITTPQQLDDVRQYLGVWDVYFELGCDIDLSRFIDENYPTVGWLPIGNDASSFQGKFNGAGHRITGIWSNRAENYVGLFGFCQNAEISGLGVEVSAGKSMVGEWHVGGIVGNMSGGSITACYSFGNVQGYINVGGIAGNTANGSVISNCFSMAAIIATSAYAGGLIGFLATETEATNCYATGTVYAADAYIGGLIGGLYGSVSNSYATGRVTCGPEGSAIGGLVGRKSSTAPITNCFFNAETSGLSAGAGTGSANITALTTAQMTASDVLTDGEMSALGSAWFKRADDAYCYFPELVIFAQSENGSLVSASKVSAMAGTGTGTGNEGESKPLSIVTAPTASDITYGQTLANSMLSGGVVMRGESVVSGCFEWVNKTVKPDAGNLQEFDVIFVPDDGSDSDLGSIFVAVNVGKKQLHAVINAAQKVYGDENPVFELTFAMDFADDDGAVVITDLIFSCTATNLSDVGNYTIELRSYSTSNYEVIATVGTLTIKKKNLTISVVAVSKVYGDANPQFVLVYSGFIDGENETNITAPIITCAAVANSPVGEYPITLTGGSADNYSFTLKSGTLTVTPKALTVSVNAASKVYGDANPQFMLSNSGFIDGENQSNITAPTATCAAVANSPVGEYPITLTGGSAENYSLILTAGTLTVTQKPLTVTVIAASKIYGAVNPQFMLSYSGFIDGENETNITAPIITCSAVANSPVGEYPITLTGGSAENYTLILIPSILTIVPQPINPVIVATVTFKNFNGDVLFATEIFIGTTPVYSGETPTRAQSAEFSYEFSGWSPALSQVTGSTVFTAQFRAVKRTYTVTFDTLGGTDVPPVQIIEYGGKVTLPSRQPTRENYKFDGWYTDTTGGTQFNFENAATTSNITLFARWSAWNLAFVIDIDMPGSALNSSIPSDIMDNYIFGEPLPTLTAPAGFSFDGWQLNGEKVISIDGLNGDAELMPIWLLNPPTVQIIESEMPDNDISDAKRLIAVFDRFDGISYFCQWYVRQDGEWVIVEGANGETLTLLNPVENAEYKCEVTATAFGLTATSANSIFAVIQVPKGVPITRTIGVAAAAGGGMAIIGGGVWLILRKRKKLKL